jgi:transcriptional regulator GlxA family with amidase domain
MLPKHQRLLGVVRMLPFDVLSAAAKGLTSHPNATVVRRSGVIVRFEKFLQANRQWPVGYGEICAAIGVSQRTLRAHCRELLGVSPMLYVRRRRMRMARAALLRADPATATVTRIAAGFGFLEFGRFSVSYKKTFRELPSATLHRPPKRMRKKAEITTRAQTAA